MILEFIWGESIVNYLIGFKDAERNFGHEDPMLTEYNMEVGI